MPIAGSPIGRNLYIVIVQLLLHESGDPKGHRCRAILPAILMMIL